MPNSNVEGPTFSLASFVSNISVNEIPDDVFHEAKRTLINVLAISLSGTQETPSRALLEWASKQSAAPRATVIGGLRTSPSIAALLNGYLAHIQDFDDTHLPTILHPSAPVWPSVLALSEDIGISGKDALAAFLLGAEVECRVAMSVYPWHYDHGWHITGTAGVFGSAAGAGRVLRLAPEIMNHCLAMAGTHASGLREALGSHAKAMHPARSASIGLESAELARLGMTGPDDIFGGRRGFWAIHSHEGHSESQLLGGLGERWEIKNNGLKPFANGIVAHPLQDAIIQIRNHNGITADQIESLVFRVNPLVVELMGRASPKTGFDGKFSYRHCVAVGLIDGAGGAFQFTDQRVKDPEVISLRSLISEIIDPEIKEDSTHLSVKLKNGETIEKYVEHAIGTPENPMSDQDLETKFMALAAEVMSEVQAKQLLDTAWSLDSAQNLEPLMNLVSL